MIGSSDGNTYETEFDHLLGQQQAAGKDLDKLPDVPLNLGNPIRLAPSTPVPSRHLREPLPPVKPGEKLGDTGEYQVAQIPETKYIQGGAKSLEEGIRNYGQIRMNPSSDVEGNTSDILEFLKNLPPDIEREDLKEFGEDHPNNTILLKLKKALTSEKQSNIATANIQGRPDVGLQPVNVEDRRDERMSWFQGQLEKIKSDIKNVTPHQLTEIGLRALGIGPGANLPSMINDVARHFSGDWLFPAERTTKSKELTKQRIDKIMESLSTKTKESK